MYKVKKERKKEYTASETTYIRTSSLPNASSFKNQWYVPFAARVSYASANSKATNMHASNPQPTPPTYRYTKEIQEPRRKTRPLLFFFCPISLNEQASSLAPKLHLPLTYSLSYRNQVMYSHSTNFTLPSMLGPPPRSGPGKAGTCHRSALAHLHIWNKYTCAHTCHHQSPKGF